MFANAKYTFESGNANNSNFNTSPKKKNFGLIIGIIIVVLIGALVCIVPLMKLTSRLDNVTQEKVESIIEDSLIEVTNTGKLTRTWYQNLQNRLAATGNTYNIEIEIHHIDENVGMKTAQVNNTKIVGIKFNIYKMYEEV